ncbi:MarR family winged helix-turn-helix transcriptional regulator [Pseudothauera rhizosphaerae]|uniref:MarR family transcriptional regulator n=1 Tax=Pseudothauera rhizosphaerae TaxID=2565932 RepID=A0A4S4AG35_9RHOO|nr:MarR family transcriptional regulator [Pseudothauera rhizosphaerae]THF57238.1 MarR family transcriptional regulator [Pseudothauera rhizosphaerae]
MTQHDPIHDDSARYATLLHRASALWRTRLDNRLRPYGMTQATWRILWLLSQDGAPCNQSELAARLGVENPTLVRTLDRMEQKGWLRRVADSRDRRRKHVEITAAGLEAARRMEGDVVAVRTEMLAGIPPDELVGGIRLLERIVAQGRAGESQGAEEER